jgi:hypothetical protein
MLDNVSARAGAFLGRIAPERRDRPARLGATPVQGHPRMPINATRVFIWACSEGCAVTDGFRVVVGNEPRYYREVLAEALRCLRPDLEIVLTEPAMLDEEAQRGGLPLVICSRLSPTILALKVGWVLLYPDGENRAVVSIAGQERVISGFEIADLLAIIAEAESMTRGDDS